MNWKRTIALVILLALLGIASTARADEPEPLHTYPWGTYPEDCDTEPILLWDLWCEDGQFWGYYSCMDYDLDEWQQYQAFDMIAGPCGPVDPVPPPSKPAEPEAPVKLVETAQHPLYMPLTVSGSVTAMCAPGAEVCPWPPTP